MANHRVDPAPCIVCGVVVKRRRTGRCDGCYFFRRRHGHDRQSARDLRTCGACLQILGREAFPPGRFASSDPTERCKKCVAAAAKAFEPFEAMVADRRAAERRRLARRARGYGITPEQYEAMYDEQDGRCAICCAPSAFGLLVIDHDHDSGIVRGLLCGTCNTGIGLLGDGVAGVGAALSYLERACNKAARASHTA